MKSGWILNKRFTQHTQGTVTLEDALFCPLYIRLADRLMGHSNWRGGGSTCNLRRMHPRPTPDSMYSSAAPWHVDALWMKDKEFTLNFWVPFTPCGNDAPGLEFLLANETDVKNHCHYNPTIPAEPKGRMNTNPCLNLKHFDNAVVDAQFNTTPHWAPQLNPGDILIFSNWAMHRTHFPPQSQHERISLEYRLYSDRPGSPSRALFL